MRVHRWSAGALVAGALLAHTETRGDDAGLDRTRRAKVVATIGTVPASRSISVGQLEDRVASIPDFQRITYGRTADAIRRHVLTDLADDVRLSLAAEAAHIESEPSVAYAVDRARSGATIHAIRDQAGSPSSISIDDVRAYYDKNRTLYDAPTRVQVWRILCKTSEEAQTILDSARKDPTPKTFAQLARDHSQDKGTYLRAGNLGFLTPDGVSNETGLRVDPAIVHAAQTVRDGELVPTPVSEGKYFAVVWRRGTSTQPKRTVDQAAPQIRDILWEQRIKETTDKVLSTLRTAKVSDLHEELLDTIDLPPDIDGGRSNLP